ITAATGLVGAAALGGGWELTARFAPAEVKPPLTQSGVAGYAAVLATRTWQGGSTSWNTLGNWSPSGVPVAGDDVIIGSTGASAPFLDVNTAALNSLTISASRTLAVGTFTLNVTGTAAAAINLLASGAQISIGGGTINDS